MTLPIDPYHHFTITRPRSTHFRPATCAESACLHHLLGWQTVVPTRSIQADYIRRRSGRRFREEAGPEGLARFVFEPGQTCFREHTAPIEGAMPILRESVGSKIRTFSEWEQWSDAMNEHVHRVQLDRR